ncbi:unnamed protein product [Rotaria sp. Silwood1]|nr:unnamed protein product [Rotaria sp. Silwood1]CAF4900901.1 unnamed protein product [Rotaria sp. Silwood1]CAF5030225.1 unnamed protein product [Rotaria sp. Silwood1]
MKTIHELSSLSMSNIVHILSDHSDFYKLFVHSHLQSLDINNVSNENNYLNENIIDLIRDYFNIVSSLSEINEQQIQWTFEGLILNLLNAFNDCTLLKYLDTHRSSCINGKFCLDCCFLYKNVNINIEKERQCLQDFIVCLDAFKKSYASLTESSIGQMLHYLHLLLDIQNRKKIYGFPINCKQITFFYVEKECKSNLYNNNKSQDLDMFNNYSETSLPVDMIITKEEWKNKYLNEVIWKIFTNFLTMSNNFYEYATLNIDPRDDLFDCRYMIRKKLGIGLTTMVYLLEKKEDNYLIEDSPHYAMKILKENDYSEYFLNEIKITEKLTQFDNSNKFYLFFQDILSPLSSGITFVF